MVSTGKNASPSRRVYTRRNILRSFWASFALILVSHHNGQSEAFATSFVPRSLALIPRGGSSSSSNQPNSRDPLTCVLQAPKSSHPLFANGDGEYKTNGRNGASAKTNGAHNNNNALDSSRSLVDVMRGGSTFSEEKPQEDSILHADYVAETNLPTDVGHYRLRAYRIAQTNNQHFGTEPCVIYSTNKPPFGTAANPAENVPVRIHDQCFTSEVFRSQR